MAKQLIALALPLLTALAGPTLAHETGSPHDHGAVAAAGDKTALPKVRALVRTVDKAARQITLKHEDIPNLGMGAMTMVFHVRDAALLDKVKAGDSVRFTADKIRGAYTVLSIEPAGQ